MGLNESDKPEIIPLNFEGVNAGQLSWILVVEKEVEEIFSYVEEHPFLTLYQATFQSLCDAGFHQSRVLGPGMTVTVHRKCFGETLLTVFQAKGYPDLATLRFLRTVCSNHEFSGQIFGLFDFDPYGIDIFRCYRAGSKVALGSSSYCIAEMKWIGVKSQHISSMHGLALTLSNKDHERVRGMLEAMTLESGMPVPGLEECRVELQRMIMLRKKAEIQTVGPIDDLILWLEQEMSADGV
jgi:hypothetical protein